MTPLLEIVPLGAPIETRTFHLGRFERYRVGGREIDARKHE